MKEIEDSPCPYEVLGVAKNASLKEIKAAYRELCSKLHPDKNDGVASDEFFRVQEAYDILSDPGRRGEYDETGSRSKHGQQFKANKHFIDLMAEAVFDVEGNQCPIVLAVNKMHEEIAHLNHDIRNLKAVRKHYLKAAGRMKVKKGLNEVRLRLENQAAGTEEIVAQKRSRIGLLEMSIDYSREYKYQNDDEVLLRASKNLLIR